MRKSTESLRIYVAGPYTASNARMRAKNVQVAIDAGVDIFHKGHYPFIPHLTHYVDIRARQTARTLEWEDFIVWDLPWLVTCDALLYLSSSRGADIELDYARKLGKIIYCSLNDVPRVVRDKEDLLVRALNYEPPESVESSSKAKKTK